MMRAPANRMALLRSRRRLGQVERGTALLRRKREALVAELFRLARPALSTRETIAARARDAYPALLEALALRGQTGLAPLGWPARDLRVALRTGQVWGMAVADIVERPGLQRTLGARGTAPTLTGPAAAAAARRFEELTELVLDAAGRESLIRRLGTALAQASRQVRMLERRVGPGLEAGIARVRQVLDEREREDQLRLRHFVNARS